jgi:hypothetical protein
MTTRFWHRKESGSAPKSKQMKLGAWRIFGAFSAPFSHYFTGKWGSTHDSPRKAALSLSQHGRGLTPRRPPRKAASLSLNMEEA